ncbi:hypothetical protein SAMN05216302_102114 [Nitrosomonas aestuarii]|uniref:Uncharacterized protein n=1 Tax=Nitrosomonas aestuarii TaxID=52441 RepID=A0A1I4DE48_9PROT|nr:hypothetical protein [Nitrosomonas aestuarii]SFK92094.1 hypothetical protein SAMN05216302_102114 [Nitrosomonas aestuarii]
MAKKEQATPQDFTKDKHWGKGGRFVVDPKTGERIPADQYKPLPTDQSDKELNNVD